MAPYPLQLHELVLSSCLFPDPNPVVADEIATEPLITASLTHVLKVFQFCFNDKEGRNALFSDTLNTFYQCLYDVRHMVNSMTHLTHFY